MPDGLKQVTSGAVGQAPDVDQSIWHAQSALYDLCRLLERTRTIRLAQLGDLEAMVKQATRARNIAAKIDLPAHEFNS